MATSYIRTPILSFCELSEKQQQSAISMHDYLFEDLENPADVDAQFVPHPIAKGDYINDVVPLGDFIRADHGIWDGIASQSYFSGLFIKISNCGECAVVAHRHW